MKENNWENEESIERTAVTLETEGVKWSKPGCLWWWWYYEAAWWKWVFSQTPRSTYLRGDSHPQSLNRSKRFIEVHISCPFRRYNHDSSFVQPQHIRCNFYIVPFANKQLKLKKFQQKPPKWDANKIADILNDY